MANTWQTFPQDVLDDTKRQEEAAQWGDQQRAKIAQEWADLHQRDTQALVNQYVPGLDISRLPDEGQTNDTTPAGTWGFPEPPVPGQGPVAGALAGMEPTIGTQGLLSSALPAMGQAGLATAEQVVRNATNADAWDAFHVALDKWSKDHPGQGMNEFIAENSPEAQAALAPLTESAVGLAAGTSGGIKNVSSAIQNVLMKPLNQALAPARNTPSVVQDAIRTFAGALEQARVDAQSAAMKIRAVLGKGDTAQAAARFENHGQFNALPNLDQQQLAQDLIKYGTDSRMAGEQGGYILGDVTKQGVNYFPHVYDDAPNLSAQVSKRSLNPRDYFSHGRIYQDLNEAVANGKTPIDSVSGPWSQYVQHVQASEAKVQFVDAIQAAAPDMVMPYRPGDRLPEGWRAGSASDPVLRSWAFDEPVADSIDNILKPSFFDTINVVRTGLEVLGTAKQTLFSLTGFHHITEFEQGIMANGVKGFEPVARAFLYMVLSPMYDKFRLAESALYSLAARTGVTGLTGGFAPDVGQHLGNKAALVVQSLTSGLSTGVGAYTMTKNAGGTEDEARSRGLLAGAIGAAAGPTLGKALTSALWDRAVPTLKVLTFKIQIEAGASPQEAADFVNRTFGGINLAAIARSKGVQDMIRIGVLAPDWWEGWLRQIGATFTGGASGQMSRAYWARKGAEAAFILGGLNLALNGHTSDQNQEGHQFDLETTGLFDRMDWPHMDDRTGQPSRTYMDLLGPVRSLLEATRDPFHFVKSHEGLLFAMGTDMLNNTDYRGKPIVLPGTPLPQAAALQTGHALSRVMPIGAQNVEQMVEGKNPLPMALASTISGRRIAQETVHQEIEKQRANISVNRAYPESVIKQAQAAGIKDLEPVQDQFTGPPKVQMTRQEWDQFVKLTGQNAEDSLSRLTSNPKWNALPQMERRTMILKIIASAKREAEAQVFGSSPRQDMNQRIRQSAEYQLAASQR